jgi:uncharacterized membrane protein YcaP (DUF421 family)
MPTQSAIDVFDMGRMLFGDEPSFYLFEVAFRTAIVYLLSLLLLRLMGKRSLRELTPTDFLIVIALGSAVGDSMFYPEVPLSHALLVVAIVVLLQRTLSKVTEISPKVEDIIEGSATLVVADGVLQRKSIGREDISIDDIFMYLRERDLEQLGQIKRAYLERSGNISLVLYRKDNIRPGLPITPPWDLEPPKTYSPGAAVPHKGYYACKSCGKSRHFDEGGSFPHCFECPGEGWVVASSAGLGEF